MKILSGNELQKLCTEIQTKAITQLEQSAKRKMELISAFKESQEIQYQSALQSYQRKMEQYQQAMHSYETNTALEEMEYPKRVKAWEEREEARKNAIEQTYERSVASYEKVKKQYEAAGQPFNVPYPQKLSFIPSPKPQKKGFFYAN